MRSFWLPCIKAIWKFIRWKPARNFHRLYFLNQIYIIGIWSLIKAFTSACAFVEHRVIDKYRNLFGLSDSLLNSSIVFCYPRTFHSAFS